ncbi:hypothetical protein SALBM135S_02217 [Streptomyces alboniger]
MGALSGEVVFRATGRTLREVYKERVRAPYGLDFFVGLPEEHEERFRPVRPMAPTPEQAALLASLPPQPQSLGSIAFNRNAADPTDLEALPNSRLVRAKGPAWPAVWRPRGVSPGCTRRRSPASTAAIPC